MAAAVEEIRALGGSRGGDTGTWHKRCGTYVHLPEAVEEIQAFGSSRAGDTAFGISRGGDTGIWQQPCRTYGIWHKPCRTYGIRRNARDSQALDRDRAADI